VGEIVVSPQNINANFRVSASSDLAKRVITTGFYEPELTAALKHFKNTINGDIINIGANVGFYSIFFAKEFPNVRKIYAIEPNIEAYTSLEFNIAENCCGNRIQPIQACIGDEAGDLDFVFIPGMSEYSSIDKIIHPSVKDFYERRITIEVQTLDELLQDTEMDPKLVFLDTEGAELLVFKGAIRLLKKYQPILIFECQESSLRKYNHSTLMVENYLKNIGYTVRNALYPRTSLQHPFVGNAIAIPKDNMEMVGRLPVNFTHNHF